MIARAQGERARAGAGGTVLPAMLVLGLLASPSGCERPPLCPDVVIDAEIPVPATNLAPSAMFPPINASTTSAPAGVAVSISRNQGTVVFDERGPLQAFIYERTSFTPAASTLYLGLAVADGAWVPFVLYCSNGLLTTVFGEMTDRDVGLLYDVEGTCSDQNVGFMDPVVIPAHTLRTVAVTCGVSATAPAPNQLQISGGQPGSMALRADSATVFPFHTVDCRTGCGSPGWYEIHAIVWDQSQASVSFGIFYLSATGVTAGNGVTLPSGNPFAGFEFPSASWSIAR